MKRKILIIGGGGHAKVIIDAIRTKGVYGIAGILDVGLSPGSQVSGVRVLGGDDMIPAIFKKGVREAFICVGSIGDCSVRIRLHRKLKEAGFELPVIRHPNSIVSTEAALGEGVYVAAGAVINTGTLIGKNAIINTSSSVDHDCIIGDFVHIAPGVVLSGSVTVGDRSHIGTGACVIQCVSIGKDCMIRAGAVIRKNLQNGTTIRKKITLKNINYAG